MAVTTRARREIPKPGSISFEDRVTKKVPHEWGYGSTPRTARLRDGLHWKAAIVKEWLNIAMGLGKCTFRQGLRVDMDRARLLTKSYRETEGQPWVIRRAKAVKTILEAMPIVIKPGELIVGDPNGAPDEVRWYPEPSVYWIPEAVSTGGFSEMVTDEERKEIVEDICEYWKDRCMLARIEAALPEELRPYVEWRTDIKPMVYDISDVGKTVPGYDYESLFKEGLKARIDRIEAKLKELDSEAWQMNPAEYLEKKNNWQAMAMCGKAIVHFAERYAALAREQARAEKDKTRKGELAEIAAILDWVPANPPRTFHEALQFYWIVEMAGRFLAVFGIANGIRFDQIWWPYYEADMKAGRITREKALELIECLFLKIQEVGYPLDWPGGFVGRSGAELFYTANICGTTPDGRDASNDLSCIIMEALVNLHINQPPIALRYHHNISPDVVDRAIDLLRTGMGHPAFFNEDLMVKWALMRGWSPKEAKNVTVLGCVVHQVKGKVEFASGYKQVGCFNLPKVLEEALFQRGLPGPLSGQDSPRIEDPRKVHSADELLELFLERVSFYTKVGVLLWNIGQQTLMEYWPNPCNSFLLDDPVEKGFDLTKLQKDYDTWPMIDLFGRINVANSLAAIQKLVFDDKKYTMEQLLKALEADWQGHEEMHQDFLNAPKFGNDDDYADDWARKVSVGIENAVNQVKDAWGYAADCSGSVAVGYDTFGFGTGATPDGRRAGTSLADGTRSPMAGTDKNGPTAVLNSAGKIPYLHPELLNQKFLPQFLEGENRALFADYLREWYEKGTISHVQFNVVDNMVLREAQQHPEKCTNLQVRVAGYSAFFVDLSKESQDAIIARTEQSLC